MSLENFPLIDKEKIDNSIIKRGFRQLFYQQVANLNASDQNVVVIFGENNIITRLVMPTFNME